MAYPMSIVHTTGDESRSDAGAGRSSLLRPPSEISSASQSIVWKLHSLDHRIASVRYRAILPILALQCRGVVSRLYRSPNIDRFRGADIVVFVKSVTVKDLILAQRVNQLGIPIILDLCDNIFVPNYMRKFPVRPAEVFEAMAQYAAVITTTGPALAQVIKRQVGLRVPIVIVPDGIETESTTLKGYRLLARARVLDLIQRVLSVRYLISGGLKVAEKVQCRIARSVLSFPRASEAYTTDGKVQLSAKDSPAKPEKSAEATQDAAVGGVVKTVIWFGNAGADYGRFGLCDVVDIAAHLERAFARVRFELLVVSNDEDAYVSLIQPLPFPSRYLQWNPGTIQKQIKESSLAIIPNSTDAFAVCKSANRAVLALHLGIPVVASRTPALEMFRDCVVLDDWEDGIVHYLTDPKLVQDHVSKASSLLSKEFSASAIANRWADALRLAKASGLRNASRSLDRRVANLVVVLHLVQDLDLAIPVLKAGGGRQDLAVRAWVSKSLMEKSPRVLRAMRRLDIPFSVVADDSVIDLRSLQFTGVDALLTMAETNQRAHRITHVITKRANAAGIHTYTMQHGFENIGLTYTDAVHPLSEVRFAAKTVFTWGVATSLHPHVREETRAKCVPVGCTKEATLSPVNIDILGNASSVIGIFENLHWHRYDQTYVERFLVDCLAIAKSYPAIMFLVKPHHAGQWLTSRYHGLVPLHPNLVIADPGDPVWEEYTASHLMSVLDAVITTPSTVALDAARVGKPVAVVGYGLDLSPYAPLTVIDDVKQWDEFIRQAEDPSTRKFLQARAKEFVDKSLCAGNAAARVCDSIVKDCKRETDVVNREVYPPAIFRVR